MNKSVILIEKGEMENMKDVKIEDVGEELKIIVDGKEIACATHMAKAVAENLLVGLDQAGAINLTIVDLTK
ncbi:hypothetical protein RGW67_19295 [Bacillus mycoides]|uniref:hypothetical protein n=1 Tax=Bacillus mycoides TaxID=1405 RepID=UPI002853621C|nr:hypothetical protein [Bacillus mycoides]MDR4903081.1 hypothetical protein [Bacillus mycoides]